MSLSRIDALVQFTNQGGENWEPNLVVPENYIVYDDTNRYFKKGNGADLIDDLPIFFKLEDLELIYNTSTIINSEIFENGNIDKLIIIDKTGKISTSLLTLTNIQDLINLINDISYNYDETIRTTSSITKPIVTYPKKAPINSTITLFAKSINSCDNPNNKLKYNWVLPDDSIVENTDTIVYDIPNNINLINTKLFFKCFAYLEVLNLNSKITEISIKILEANKKIDPVVIGSSLTNIFI